MDEHRGRQGQGRLSVRRADEFDGWQRIVEMIEYQNIRMKAELLRELIDALIIGHVLLDVMAVP